MKVYARFRLFWLAALILTLSGGAQAATSKSTKTSKGTATTATSKSGSTKSYTIARNPYVGAIVLEPGSGRVLFEENADTRAYPASVLKLMDLLIITEKIKRGEISLQDQVVASAKAAQTGGSQVWLAHNESFTIDEMLYALMVRSANDVAVALAEKVSGSTEAFVELMNARARELGMNNTRFQSVHGLPPAKGQNFDTTTARDIGILCRELLKHPEALRYTSTRVRTFRPGSPKAVEMRTHNHLLAAVDGCDGLKTGYIAAAGFSIAVTAQRNGQRVVVVVLDSIDLKTRDTKAKELVAKGFAALQSTGTARAVAAPAASAAQKR